jgi:hypothetical protein
LTLIACHGPIEVYLPDLSRPCSGIFPILFRKRSSLLSVMATAWYLKGSFSARLIQKRNWEDVPVEIKQTFERLGIPESERKFLAGVEAQFDSEAVYSNIKKGEVISIALAGNGQHQDTGAKMIHAADETTSNIVSRSISVGKGRATYRGLVHIPKRLKRRPSYRHDRFQRKSDALPSAQLQTLSHPRPGEAEKIIRALAQLQDFKIFHSADAVNTTTGPQLPKYVSHTFGSLDQRWKPGHLRSA